MNKKGDISFFITMTMIGIIAVIVMAINEPVDFCTEPIIKHCYRESAIHSQIETSCNNEYDYYYNYSGEDRKDCIPKRVKGFD